MKKIFLFLSCAAIFASCSDEYFDINRDPDNLSADGVAFSTELPAGIAGIAGSQGAYYALIGGFWSQMFTQSNASNQYKEIDDYSIGTLDYNAGWTSMYDALADIRNIKSRAEAEGNWNYFLITTVLETHASQIMADFYDQIPYSEANNVNFLQPRFDTGEEVYDQMAEALQLALSKDLSTSQGEVPGSDDFIFGGNMTNWTAYANTLLLKVYMRQTEARPAVAQAGITALLNAGTDFLNIDAAVTQFEDAPDRSNPLYETDRRQLNTTTNIRASRTMFSYLDENGDPRRLSYYDPGNPLNQGDFNNSAIAPTSIAVVHLEPTTPVYFMSREESLFLQAEAAARYAGGAGAKVAYDAAVQESFSKWGLNGAPFVASGGAYEYDGATLDDQIKDIITQKWLASFPGNGHEAFFEHNRTGYPEISAVPQTDAGYVAGEFAYSIAGTTGGDFPKRLVFPENVKSVNQNAPALVELTVPVWWDAN